MSGKTLSELFSNCLLYVLPSDIEGMPMSLLEAVGYDARVLVSDIPENTACLDGYGNAFKHSNTADLKEKLAYILAHEDLKMQDFKADSSAQQTQQKRAELMEKYDWNTITDQTLDIYRSVKK